MCVKIFLVLENLRLCAHTKWECGSGECLPMEMRCDGIVQCKDKSDELHCGMYMLLIFFFFNVIFVAFALMHVFMHNSCDFFLKSNLIC